MLKPEISSQSCGGPRTSKRIGSSRLFPASKWCPLIWFRWKEVVYTAKEAQDQLEMPPPLSRADIPHTRTIQTQTRGRSVIPDPIPDDYAATLRRPDFVPKGFCETCFVPVADDPDPETLFIYLHALRYTTEALGVWETPLPRWAGAKWDGDWRGWVDD